MCILSIELIYILSSWGKAKTKGEEVGKRWFHQVYWMVCVRVYSSIWHYMALYGSMWQYMAVIENKCGWCCGLASAVNLSRSQMADPWLLACDRLALNAGGNPVGESRSRGWGCQGRQSQRQSQLSFVFFVFFYYNEVQVFKDKRLVRGKVVSLWLCSCFMHSTSRSALLLMTSFRNWAGELCALLNGNETNECIQMTT